MPITRRQVLAAMAAVSATGTVAVGATAWRWWDRPPGAGLKVLSQHEYDIVQSLAEAWMPRGGTPLLSGADADLGGFFDAMLADMAAADRKGLKLLLQAVDDLCLPRYGATFTSLPLETRTMLVGQMVNAENNLVRSAFSALLVLLGVGWTTHPDVVAVLKPMFRCGYGR